MARRTRIDLNWGSIAHIFLGIFTSLLELKWLITVIFIIKQLIDLMSGEDYAEVSGDIVEYTIGIILGKTIMLLLDFIQPIVFVWASF